MPKCLASNMIIDVICLSILNIDYWFFLFFKGGMSLMYVNVGMRHCDEKKIAKSIEIGRVDQLGPTLCSRAMKFSGLSYYIGVWTK